MVTYHGSDCESYLSVDMSSASSIMQLGSAVDCFKDNSWGYIEIPDSAIGEWFYINTVVPGAQTIDHSNGGGLSRAYPQDAIVKPLTQLKFYVDGYSGQLMIERKGTFPAVYAEDIGDLQFKYRLANGLIVDQPVLISDVRTVLIEVKTKSTRESEYVDGNDPAYRTYSSAAHLRNNY